MIVPRWFQKEAFNEIVKSIRRCVDPVLVEAATGSGKSIIVAMLSEYLVNNAPGKIVLNLAPSAELVIQNREKFMLTGNPASLYSASAGGKTLRHPVIFGSPGTVVKVAANIGKRVCAIVIDEAHGITDTIKEIIRLIRIENPNVRIVGLSATPYRLGEGFIYKIDTDGKPVGEDRANDPFFLKCIYRIGAHRLIEERYLTPPRIGVINAAAYETAGIILKPNGKFDEASNDRAFVGKGRKTSAIVADIVEQSRNKMGVMIFAATTQHAQEIMESLPPELSRMVSGDPKITSKDQRRQIIKDFKARKFKYLVNVAVLTTGFDASHVDVIALMRATESVALLQQIIGRGLRLFITKEQADNWDSYTIDQRQRILDECGKSDVLLLDYGQNIEKHCPEGDIFDPRIKAGFGGGVSAPLKAVCELCQTENEFSARQNPEQYAVDKNGYFCDLRGVRIKTEFGPMPAHHGRRCQGVFLAPGGAGVHDQCSHRWTFKPCPSCGEDNDIAARYCSHKSCKAEIINPNDKLAMEFKALKKDPKQEQTDRVVRVTVGEHFARGSGKTITKVIFETTHRNFTIWLDPSSPILARQREWAMYLGGTDNGKFYPETVTYKMGDDKFYKVLAYNQPADELILNEVS